MVCGETRCDVVHNAAACCVVERGEVRYDVERRGADITWNTVEERHTYRSEISIRMRRLMSQWSMGNITSK